ncbi:hypothetical protein ACYU0V_06715 [Acinetobacter sp. X9]
MAGVTKTKIGKNLKELDKLYNRSNSNMHKIFYSKLALIEYCGWLENSIDILMFRAMKNISESTLKKDGESNINRSYGFTFSDHFKSLLIKILGLSKTQELILWLKQSGDFVVLESKLNNLKTLRNEAAHNYYIGNQAYHSPQFYIQELHAVYPIFVNIYSFLVKHIR